MVRGEKSEVTECLGGRGMEDKFGLGGERGLKVNTEAPGKRNVYFST